MNNMKQSMTKLFLTVALMLTLAACGGGYDGTSLQTGEQATSGTGSTSGAANSASAYTAIAGVRSEITPIEDAVGSAARFVAYRIAPVMTNGFVFDINSGQISGTPIAVESEKTYTITATDSLGGITTIMVTITTEPEVEAPIITVSDANPDVTEGQPIIPITFTNSGMPDIATYTISPELLHGLDFDPTTGEISGIPTAPPSGTFVYFFVYFVTATNNSGSDTVQVSITVNSAAPEITASTATVIGTIGMPINPFIITNTAGAAIYTINPSIGNNLDFDSATGEIYGTPSAPLGTTTYTITAINDQGVTDAITVTVIIQTNLPAPNINASSVNITATAGSLITPVTVTNDGGTVDSYSIAPAIANGLAFNRATGEISGTPTAAAGVVNYVITATNNTGTSSTNVAITVQDASPDITASTPEFTVTAGIPIIPLTIINTGGAIDRYEISPAIGNGLTFDPTTGEISGIATAPPTGRFVYDITAINPTGSDTVQVVIIVSDTPLAPDITASQSAVTVTEKAEITPISITNTGGSASYTIFPNINNGLIFDSDTGTISGTPTAVANEVYYVVIATNNQGTSVSSIAITVQLAAPIIVASQTVVSAAVAVNIAPITIINTGGAIDRYEISPAIDNGLAFNSTTGEISGTPIATMSVRYEITATNSMGSDTAMVDFIVSANLALPNIVANPSVVNGVVGTAITPIVVINSGGAATYTISPGLPSGLTFDQATGGITGRPNAISTSTYTITATNNMGSDSVIILIDVAAAVSTLPIIDDQAAVIYTADLTISPITFINSGVAAVSCTVLPTLPTGLSIVATSNGNCVISGSSSVVSNIRTYTVTATTTAGTSDTADVDITVVAAAAPILSASGITVTVNTPFPPIAITNSGDPIVGVYNFSVNGVSTGVSFNSATGVISGIPSVVGTITYTVTGANTGGNHTVTVTINVVAAAAALPNITAAPVITTGVVGTDIAPIVVTNSGGTATYTISPSLPNGLTFDPATGGITGRPNAATSGFAEYTITATNSSGNTDDATIYIMIAAAVSTVPIIDDAQAVTYTQNQTITPLIFGNSGADAVSCSASLPTGLLVAANGSGDCVITGMPTVVVGTANYTITATGSNGLTDTATVDITVVAPVPTSPIIDDQQAVIYTADLTISPITFANSGVAAADCTVLPSLPTGLSIAAISNGNCVISGSPSVVSSIRTYTVTATTTAGTSDTADVDITVVAAAIPILVASETSITVTVGTIINPAITIRNNGGPIVRAYSSSVNGVSTGVSFNTVTGVISGIPSVVGTIIYDVMGSNTGGSDSVTVTINVVSAAPTAPIIDDKLPVIYTAGQAIPDLIFANSGVAAANCTVLPTLPTGLSVVAIANGNCVISGIPSAVSNIRTYRVTATTTAGTNDTADVDITVVAPAVPDIVATPSSVSAIAGVAITQISIANSGGAATYTIAPGLPSSLSIDSDTGAITGNSTVLGTTTYTITATGITGLTDMVDVIITITTAAPIIGDQQAITYTAGQIITPLIFRNTGAFAVTCAVISNGFPTGLSVASNADGDCEITGTPTVVAARNTFIIRATSAANAGSDTARVDITVVAAVPTAPIIDDKQPVIYTAGLAIPDLIFANSGVAATNCTVLPTLPTGLSVVAIANGNCVISGIPSAVSNIRTYRVTATTTAGTNDTADVDITVVAPAVPDIVATPSSVSAIAGVAITQISIANSGGAATYTIAPGLPSSLSIDSDTGAITGNSTVLGTTTYTITATGITGLTDMVDVIITITTAAPIIDNLAAITYTAGQRITPLIFRNTGAFAVTCAVISNGFPTGLSVASNADGDCEITGTPTVVAARNTFIIRATSAANAGSDTARVDITVVAAVPTAPIIDDKQPVIYTAGLAIPDLIFANSGVAAADCTVVPSLPTGLSVAAIANGNCLINGIPSAVSNIRTYTVTATTLAGTSDTADVDITVVAPAVPDIVATPSSVSAITGVAISQISIANSGGTATYTISPSLPNGLSIDSDTGAITGNSTVLGTTTYTITATGITGLTDMVDVIITITTAAPIIGDQQAITYTAGQIITPLIFRNTGAFAVTCVAISNGFPRGLSVAANADGDCEITGTPIDVVTSLFINIRATSAGNGGSDTAGIFVTVVAPAPTAPIIDDKLPVIYTAGQAIPDLIFANSGVAATNCTVLPTLPTGLSVVAIANGNCVISGIPSAVSNIRTYTVTATTLAGTTDTADVDITVVAPAVPDIVATPSSVSAIAGVAISQISIANSGGTATYTISPSLPNGLSIDSDTGAITGNSTVLGTTTYTITATGITGLTDMVDVIITITTAAPIIGDQQAITYTAGQIITPLIFRNTGAFAVTCAVISNGFPTGLSVASNADGDCEITGTPTVVAARNTFIIRATSAANAGSDTARVDITVVAAVPTAPIIDDKQPVIYTAGLAIPDLIFANSGVAATNCTVLPTLPTGLSVVAIANGNCVISGIPSAVSNIRTYRVTATTTAGTNDTADVDITVVAPAVPDIVATPSSVSAIAGVAITQISIANSGGAATYTIAPGLPSSLSIDSDTGAITGNSTVLGTTTYTITATGITGLTDMVDVIITITTAAPIIDNLAAITYTAGQRITPLIFRNTGAFAVTCAVISNGFPTGLSVASNADGDCEITGTPTVVAARNTFIIRATSAANAGSDTARVDITVVAAVPTAPIIDDKQPVIYTAGLAIPDLIFANSGVAAADCTVVPSLPTGLSVAAIANGNCLINGIPSAVSNIRTYTVTATTLAGTSDTADVDITVVAPAVPDIVATPSSVSAITGVAISQISIANSGGTATYTISPSLPNGLSIDSDTGAITGNSTVLGTTTYTITATGITGLTDMVDVIITITPLTPSLTANPSSVSATAGTAITQIIIANSGGAATYTISPSLPSGLSIDSGTGIISGSTTVLGTTTYTITATGTTALTDTVDVIITITPLTPSLTANPSSVSATAGTAITQIIIANSGGAATYTISPNLPSGLSIDSGTGTISGSTTVLGTTTYTITGTGTTALTDTVDVIITITPLTPSLTANPSSVSATAGTAISQIIIANSGGTATYTISPNLPSGLSIDSGTGTISGSTTVLGTTTYTITGTGTTALTDTVDVVITITPLTPSLTATPSSVSATAGTAISQIIIANSGGAATYTIAPSLPNGLSIDSGTGTISGSTTVLGTTTYTITATGTTALNDTVDVTITITPPAAAVMTVTSAATGREWMDRNLGATRACTSATDTQCYGDLYQFGRAADGHQLIDRSIAGNCFNSLGVSVSCSSVTVVTSLEINSLTAIDAKFIAVSWTSVSDALASAAWKDGGVNDICPAGFEVPTRAEFEAETNLTNIQTAFISNFKIPAAGFRQFTAGALIGIETIASFWYSDSTRGGVIIDGTGVVYNSALPAATGASIRCIKK